MLLSLHRNAVEVMEARRGLKLLGCGVLDVYPSGITVLLMRSIPAAIVEVPCLEVV